MLKNINKTDKFQKKLLKREMAYVVNTVTFKFKTFKK